MQLPLVLLKWPSPENPQGPPSPNTENLATVLAGAGAAALERPREVRCPMSQAKLCPLVIVASGEEATRRFQPLALSVFPSCGTKTTYMHGLEAYAYEMVIF